MTLELLATIAALCALPGSGPIFIAKNEMIKCQKAYIKCAYAKGANKYTNKGDILVECVMERES